MSRQSTSTDDCAPPRSKVLRWLLVVGALCGVVFIGLMYFPVYRLDPERDETGGAIDFLRDIQAFQVAHLRQHGRYLGDIEWAEWPTGPFPSKDGVDWGNPTTGVWARLPLRPREPLLFKFRLRAGDRPEQAPQTVFPKPPSGPWYVVQARADLDGDQKIWLIEMTSVVGAIYFENSGE